MINKDRRSSLVKEQTLEQAKKAPLGTHSSINSGSKFFYHKAAHRLLWVEKKQQQLSFNETACKYRATSDQEESKRRADLSREMEYESLQTLDREECGHVRHREQSLRGNLQHG